MTCSPSLMKISMMLESTRILRFRSAPTFARRTFLPPDAFAAASAMSSLPTRLSAARTAPSACAAAAALAEPIFTDDFLGKKTVWRIVEKFVARVQEKEIFSSGVRGAFVHGVVESRVGFGHMPTEMRVVFPFVKNGEAAVGRGAVDDDLLPVVKTGLGFKCAFERPRKSGGVVSVDGNNYTDLQSAIDDTEDGAVIKLINDNDVSASINTEKTITIDKDNHTGVVDIVVPPTLILTKTDNEDGTTTYKVVTKYTVTFNANGGTGTMAVQEIGGKAALNANTFTREGFVFDCWNTKADGKGTAYADKTDITPTADMTLYAQWKENPKTEDKKEEDKSKDDKKEDEPKTDDKKADEPKIDETLEASKKNAEDKINNVVAEVNKIVDSLTNITAEKKEELKKQNDTTIADAKLFVRLFIKEKIIRFGPE